MTVVVITLFIELLLGDHPYLDISHKSHKITVTIPILEMRKFRHEDVS